ncbi:uncharacterized protein LOC131243661 isoform X2 [Magnolia sinica]|uniref:uncharacterized protein LOC131243661 isoform X2 n=1 Tax=Magnolia sinica TaxID=86752 RepID=UPI002658268E|nr:uncharacterized protein LOC131243661 isoform X2 [Magnolia sinica]
MGDSLHRSGSSKSLYVASIDTSKKSSRQCLVASAPKIFSLKTFNGMFPRRNAKLGGGSTEQMVFFLLKVVSLEMVRRFSRARCPSIWRGLQALHLLCYPPFKWLQRWTPLRILINGMQKLSRPLLFLSIATAFSDESDYSKETSDNVDESQSYPEIAAAESTPDMRICAGEPEDVEPENWMLQLYKELESQGITLPERIDEDELRRFYTAANGDFSCLLSSIKKTIRWRETYTILSAQELEMWSHLVFWHGHDVKLRPCLIIRLGLACSRLASDDRPRFAQAVVSQIEHGVLHLVNAEDPRITVLMDCKGVSALKFPMQMMRSCSTLMQDHFPNRLGLLFVLRLPPVVRVIAQTFIQVLRPSTRQKLRVEGERYINILSEHLEMIPAFLGGRCTCSKCQMLCVGHIQPPVEETHKREVNPSFEDDDLMGDTYLSDPPMNGGCDQILRTAIIGVLMLWIFIALLTGMHDPDNLAL